jgi:hypothetical protein
VLDEVDMASNSSTKVATQRSIKKYITDNYQPKNNILDNLSTYSESITGIDALTLSDVPSGSDSIDLIDLNIQLANIELKLNEIIDVLQNSGIIT